MALPRGNARIGRWLTRLALGVAVGSIATRLAAASLVATLDEPTTQTGEPVTLSLTFEGVEPGTPPAPPAVTNLLIAYLGQSSQVRVINSRVSSTVSYNYAVTATQPGEYTIPAIAVTVGGETLTTQPVKLAVSKGDDRFAQVAFLKLVAPKTEAYVGEAMALEIRFYFQGGQLRQHPQLKGDGVTIGKLVPMGDTAVQTNGLAYRLWTYAVPVTFVKAGDFALSVGDCVLDIQFRSPNRRRSLFGDRFFDSPFDSLETRRLTLASDPVTIRVHALPTNGVPPEFTGAVGDFNLSAGVNTNVVTAGDPITLTVRLTGQGAIETLRWEASSAWPGFKTYPSSTQVTNTDPLGLSGTKTFEQALIPEGPQVKQIPPITFSFFDPNQRRYRSVSQPATAITVKPAALAVAQPVVVAAPEGGETARPPATDIVYIKTRPGTFAQLAPPWVERPGFLMLQCVPLALWLTALVWRRRVDRLARDPRLRRRQQVVRLMREGLAELRQAAEANRAEAFYAITFRLLQEQLGERFDLPASAITEAVVDERLQPLEPDPGLVAGTRELFQLCNQARYARETEPGELVSLLPKVQTLLQQLQALPTHASR